MHDPYTIHIFKTALEPEDQEAVGNLLSNDNILRWTVDFEDVDKVLRIESMNISSGEIIQLMTHSGYSCEELI